MPDDLRADVEPEAEPAIVERAHVAAASEACEQTRQIAARDSDPAVRDRRLDAVGSLVHGDFDRLSTRRVLEGVHDESSEDLQQSLRISLDEDRRVWNGDDQIVDALVAGERRDEAADELGVVEALPAQ